MLGLQHLNKKLIFFTLLLAIAIEIAIVAFDGKGRYFSIAVWITLCAYHIFFVFREKSTGDSLWGWAFYYLLIGLLIVLTIGVIIWAMTAFKIVESIMTGVFVVGLICLFAFSSGGSPSSGSSSGSSSSKSKRVEEERCFYCNKTYYPTVFYTGYCSTACEQAEKDERYNKFRS
ncbi:hypothetical protein EN12_23650 [Vibrio cholerae]|nr:hypothetical protein EN12_23650 [Vibrio cholerae]